MLAFAVAQVSFCDFCFLYLFLLRVPLFSFPSVLFYYSCRVAQRAYGGLVLLAGLTGRWSGLQICAAERSKVNSALGVSPDALCCFSSEACRGASPPSGVRSSDCRVRPPLVGCTRRSRIAATPHRHACVSLFDGLAERWGPVECVRLPR
ncbi:hypothetical protein NDU88_000019 [Pleurodeles waltl]|uniref:Secreted protein n=1 Tax=Pleurodeles waltl TaxID=8319 RepID=A0AAV7TEK2_PLEWA|nr:hypothetical protein NDU88_000019 [Pleurodeles waltl]